MSLRDMMMSKIVIFIAVFVAVCFRNSEGTEVLRCHTDDVFSQVADDNRNKIMVPILVKSSTYNDQIIVESLKKSSFGTIIILDADKNKCPVSVEYFSRFGGTSYPLLYFMKNGKLYNKVWNSTMGLKKFCIEATQNQNVRSSSETVPDTIKREMGDRGSSTVGRAKANSRAESIAKKAKLGVVAGMATLTVVGGVLEAVADVKARNLEAREPRRLNESEASNQRSPTQAESSRNVERTRARDMSTGRFVSQPPRQQKRGRLTSTRSHGDSEILENKHKKHRNNSF